MNENLSNKAKKKILCKVKLKPNVYRIYLYTEK